MKKTKNKIVTIAITMILMLTIVIPFASMPSAKADNVWATYPVIDAFPNPDGVGQQATILTGITMQVSYPSNLQTIQTTGVDIGWRGLTVMVTKPDNTTETLGPFNTDVDGIVGVSYIPTMAGTYYLQTHFPNQTMPYTTAGVPAGTMMLSSDSAKYAFNVTQEPRQYYPGQPVPTDFWTRPIDSQLREWSSISGNWLAPQGGLAAISSKLTDFNNNSPASAHILWSTVFGEGSGAGLVGGGANGQNSYYNGDAYEGRFLGSVIIAGVLYYNQNPALYSTQQVVAVDLHTGEMLWTQNWNNTRLAFGQILHWDSPNGHGSYSFLWATNGTTWNAYDPATGTWIFGMTNVPSGTNYYGVNGEILKYTVDLTHGWMARWNSTWAVKYWDAVNPFNVYSRFSYLAGHSRLEGTTLDASHGYDLNVTIPKGAGSAVVAAFCTGSDTDRMILSILGTATTNVWGISLKQGQEGTLLFNNTWNNPSAWITGNQTLTWEAFDPITLVGTLWDKELRAHYGVSLTTGALLWGPTPSQDIMDVYYPTGTNIALGTLFASGIGGTVYAYNVTTGAVEWTYSTPDTYVEFKMSQNWWAYIDFVTPDGKIYIGSYEHSQNNPMPRGAPYVCLNATTGKLIWSIDGAFRQTMWGGPGIIGDSIIATMDTYDQQIYAIGKGPSATTVTAPDGGVQFGSSVTIRGTVNDVSPGTNQDALKLRFPNGVPAVSDASQSDWMLYVYKQFSAPTNATGVKVTLSVVDSNNNFRDIGTTTSDSSGFYSYQWQPDIPGKYTVIARFVGTESYYGSYAETAFTVDQAATTAPTSTVQAVSSDTTQMYVIGIGVAIIIAIAIVGALIMMTLRKRP